MPRSASTADLTAGCSGAPEDEIIRSAGNFNDFSPFVFAYSTSNANIEGTPSKMVIWSRSSDLSAWTGSKREDKYSAEPLSSAPSKTTESPTACDIGRTPYRRSSGVSERICAETAAINNKLRWVNTTPFGSPVVPEI